MRRGSNWTAPGFRRLYNKPQGKIMTDQERKDHMDARFRLATKLGEMQGYIKHALAMLEHGDTKETLRTLRAAAEIIEKNNKND